jgi:3-phenylpropionate/trans-cinnamate dioxygenase ferredoxin reductase component
MGVIIVGAGHAGFQAAASLRAEGYADSITLFGDEAHLPYQRPPLSKGILLGKQEERHAILRPPAFFETQRIELRRKRIHGLDELPPFDHLILATGTRNRRLNVPGAEHALYLRTLAESQQVRARLLEAEAVAIIGGGFIGLEVAAAARTLGKRAIVIEAQGRLLARAVAPSVSAFLREQHTTQGVELYLNTAIGGIEPNAVILDDGARVPTDLVVVGIGVEPNIEIASGAGLACNNGIEVDQSLRTSEARIFAIGDCANFPSRYTGTRVRLESVQNAVDQAASVARTIMGRGEAYDAVPWFWSDQFDVHLQTAGLSHGFTHTVLRGSTDGRNFSQFYFRDETLIAVDSINQAAEHLLARKLVAARARPTPAQVGDAAFDLKALL